MGELDWLSVRPCTGTLHVDRRKRPSDKMNLQCFILSVLFPSASHLALYLDSNGILHIDFIHLLANVFFLLAAEGMCRSDGMSPNARKTTTISNEVIAFGSQDFV